MADTGSELAESGARLAPHVAERLLERHFMLKRMERMREPPPTVTRTSVPAEGEYACTLVVTPAKGSALDLRAHEVLDALERSGANATFHVDDSERTITLSVPPGSLEPVQRAIERLQADARSSFTLAEVTGLDALEEATGQRTLHPWTKGKHQTVHPEDYVDRDTLRFAPDTDHHATPGDEASRQSGKTTPRTDRGAVLDEDHGLEHVTLTFSDFPDSPSIDRTHAKEYAERMRERGMDAHVGAERADGSSVVAVTFPVAENETFFTASVEVLDQIGALAVIEGDIATEEPEPEPREPEESRGHDDAAAWEVEPMVREDALAQGPLTVDAQPEEILEPTATAQSPADDVATPTPQSGTRMPKEHVMVVFASDTDRDLTDAQAYVRAMTERGYDPWHAAMGTRRGVRHTIELSYPADERERFAYDHASTLHAIGALDEPPELDVLEEPLYQPKDLEELVDERIEEMARDAQAPVRTAADDYLALSPTERARIAPERIPDGAFGRPSLAQAMEAARAAADELALEAAPERAIEHALGERV